MSIFRRLALAVTNTGNHYDGTRRSSPDNSDLIAHRGTVVRSVR